MLQATRAVLFDLDGTLLDAFASHYRVYRRLFADLAMAFDEAAYARHYSPNWYLMYERLGLPRERWEEADRLWLRYYAEETPQERAGAGEVLRAVERSGRALGLVTSGDRRRVERDLDRLGWTPLFDVVVCGGDVVERKPDPAPLRYALRRLRVGADAAAYVGDTVEDIRMGRAAGVLTVAVLGGFGSAAALRAASPDLVVGGLEDLMAFF